MVSYPIHRSPSFRIPRAPVVGTACMGFGARGVINLIFLILRMINPASFESFTAESNRYG